MLNISAVQQHLPMGLFPVLLVAIFNQACGGNNSGGQTGADGDADTDTDTDTDRSQPRNNTPADTVGAPVSEAG